MFSKGFRPDKFVTSFNRRVYESLTSKITDLQDCSVSSFNGEFSPEEVGKITEILEKYSELGIDAKVAEDYINVLLNYKPKEKQEDISDDDSSKSLKKCAKRIKQRSTDVKIEIGVFEMTDKETDT